MIRLARLPLLLSLLAGCPAVDDLVVADPIGCDPMDTTLCGLPYPSNYYTEADSTTETGLRVAFTANAIPGNKDDVPFTPTMWNRKDGFSISSAMVTWFEEVSLEGVIPLDNPGAYLDADAKTVLINTETGERVAHFVELDVSGDDEDEQLLMLRPMERLDFGTRYIIGIRNLEKTTGGPVDISAGFLATRDAVPTEDGDVELRRAHYESDIFPALADEGFAREDLQLAWDFTTASRASLLEDMLWVREDALHFIEQEDISYAIDSIDNRDCTGGGNGRVIEAHIVDFPLYQTADEGGQGLARDANGLPMRNGTRNVPFYVRIPCSVVASPEPSKIIQYGHGFFGDSGESGTGWLSHWTDDNGYIVVANNWTGMDGDDFVPLAAILATDFSGFNRLPEGTFQGFAEHMAVLRLATTALPGDPATQIDVDGTLMPTMDGSDFAFYGISQGGILGGAYVGLSPDIERAVFGVTGGPYSFLTHRSADFTQFFAIFKAKYDDHREIGLMIQHMQMLWDPGENTGWGYDFSHDVPAGMPVKQVLIQNAIGDAQVTTYAGHLQARMYGASTVAPQTRAIYGIDERTPPFMGSAIVEWDYSDVGDVPAQNLPPDHEVDPHECPRRNPAGQLQVAHFLNTGEVAHFCDGVCVDVQETCR